MLTRALVVALAAILSGCTAEVEEQYTDKLVSCSVSVPQDWRDALERNQLTSDTAVKIEAASPDGRATIVQTWGSELQLRLHTADGLRQPIASGRGSFTVREFDGRRVRFSYSKGNGEPATFHTWDADTGAPPVRVDEKVPDRELRRHSDGTTSVWTEEHRLFAHRADWPQQRQIAEIEKSHRVGYIWSPHVHGDFVSWSAMDSLYVTDLRTGSSVHSTKGYSLSVVGGALVMFGKTVASSTPLSSLSPLPAC
jgi:hypothetical protein